MNEILMTKVNNKHITVYIITHTHTHVPYLLPVYVVHDVGASGEQEQMGPCQKVPSHSSSAACELQMDPWKKSEVWTDH